MAEIKKRASCGSRLIAQQRVETGVGCTLREEGPATTRRVVSSRRRGTVWNRTNQLIRKRIGKVADRVSCQAFVTISLVSPCSRLVGPYGATMRALTVTG
jgi:hypothetical protein